MQSRVSTKLTDSLKLLNSKDSPHIILNMFDKEAIRNIIKTTKEDPLGLIPLLKLCSLSHLSSKEIQSLCDRLLSINPPVNAMEMVFHKFYKTLELVPQQYLSVIRENMRSPIEDKIRQSIDVYYLLDQLVGFKLEDGTWWAAGERIVIPDVNPLSPAVVKSSSPAVVKSSSPAVVKPSSPAVVKPSSPAVVKPSSPAAVRSSSPAVVKPSSPAVVRSSSPAVVKSSSPAVVRPSSPAVVKSPSPMDYDTEDESDYLEDKSPSPVAIKSPSPVAIKSPSLVAIKSSSPVVVKSPSPMDYDTEDESDYGSDESDYDTEEESEHFPDIDQLYRESNVIQLNSGKLSSGLSDFFTELIEHPTVQDNIFRSDLLEDLPRETFLKIIKIIKDCAQELCYKILYDILEGRVDKDLIFTICTVCLAISIKLFGAHDWIYEEDVLKVVVAEAWKLGYHIVANKVLSLEKDILSRTDWKACSEIADINAIYDEYFGVEESMK